MIPWNWNLPHNNRSGTTLDMNSTDRFPTTDNTILWLITIKEKSYPSSSSTSNNNVTKVTIKIFAKLEILSNQDKMKNIYEINFPGAQKISLPDCSTVKPCFGPIIGYWCSRGILKIMLNFDPADIWLEPACVHFWAATQVSGRDRLAHLPKFISEIQNIYTDFQTLEH